MSKIKCKECGKHLSAKARVCPNCGTSTRYKTRIIILIISIIAIIIIIIILVLLYFAFRKQLYTDVGYSYSTSINDYAYTYSYTFQNDNTYRHLISKGDIQKIVDEMKDNSDFEYLLNKYTKTTITKGTYTINKNKIYLQEEDTYKDYVCEIVCYDKIKFDNITNSFARNEQIEMNKYLKEYLK